MEDPRTLALAIFFGVFFAFFIAVFYLAVHIKPRKESGVNLSYQELADAVAKVDSFSKDKHGSESSTLLHYLLEKLLKREQKSFTSTK
jgi:hypothetical protein